MRRSIYLVQFILDGYVNACVCDTTTASASSIAKVTAAATVTVTFTTSATLTATTTATTPTRWLITLAINTSMSKTNQLVVFCKERVIWLKPWLYLLRWYIYMLHTSFSKSSLETLSHKSNTYGYDSTCRHKKNSRALLFVTVVFWNKLPQVVVDQTSMDAFKTALLTKYCVQIAHCLPTFNCI